MNFKELARDYFCFTRKERIGLLTLVILILAVWLSPRFIHSHLSPILTDTAWISAVKQLQQPAKEIPGPGKFRNEPSEYSSSVQHLAYRQPGKLFFFDPNLLSAEEWERLGVAAKTAKTIHNYLSKGGHFLKAADLGKIYGISPGQFALLEPYIRIATPDKTGEMSVDKPAREVFNKPLAAKPLDINTADTSLFIALPGIGSRLAGRIVSFREKLGGFYSVDQVAELYGLQDSIFQKIKPYLRLGESQVKKININTSSKDDLKSHPYIRWALANAIVEYRNQHGTFSSVEDLKKISVVTDELFRKVKPYLSLE